MHDRRVLPLPLMRTRYHVKDRKYRSEDPQDVVLPGSGGLRRIAGEHLVVHGRQVTSKSPKVMGFSPTGFWSGAERPGSAAGCAH